MLTINPKKFKEIKNKTIPNPLRPKFRSKTQANIYFLSKRKFSGERNQLIIKRFKTVAILTAILVGGYFLSN